MNELQNLSIWKRTVKSHFKYNQERNIKTPQTIYLQGRVMYAGQLHQRLDVYYRTFEPERGQSESFDTLRQAKEFLKSWDDEPTRWEHFYGCQDCETELVRFETDYSDFYCPQCNATYTRFGEKSRKHI